MSYPINGARKSIHTRTEVSARDLHENMKYASLTLSLSLLNLFVIKISYLTASLEGVNDFPSNVTEFRASSMLSAA